MKYWEMVLDPLAIAMIVYLLWRGPGLIKAYQTFKRDRGSSLTLRERVSFLRESFSRKTPSWLRWGALAWILVGFALFLWEEVLAN